MPSGSLYIDDGLICSQATSQVEDRRLAELVAGSQSGKPSVGCGLIRHLLHDQRHLCQRISHAATAPIRIEPAVKT